MPKKILLLLFIILASVSVTASAQTLEALQTKIENKLSSMKMTNSTTESKLESKIESCITNSSEFTLSIDNFDKEEATYDQAGSITFDINIKDATGIETLVTENKVIDKLNIYVYRKLNILTDKYLTVTDTDILNKVKDNKDYDESKYYVTDSPVDTSDLLTEGWNTVDDKQYYVTVKDGVKTGWTVINADQYYLDEVTGQPHVFWIFYNGHYYFLDNTGKVLTGFKTIDDVTYYLTPPIQVSSDVIYTKDYSATLPSMGMMVTGWKLINGTWYFFDGSGAMAKGWKWIGDYWYHFNVTGVLDVNTVIDTYRVDENGHWVS